MSYFIGDRNKHRYVLAVESAALRSKIRNEVVGVPVVHTNDRNVLVMEPMSDLTRQRCDEVRYPVHHCTRPPS
jgi:U3 small nucleolar RNA-associated protein 23